MTSAQITDIPVYANIPNAPAKPQAKDGSDDFKNIVSEALAGEKDGISILTDHLSRPKSEGTTESYDLVNTKPQKFDAAGRVQAANEKKPIDTETVKKTGDAIEDYGSKVRDKLKDEMEVTDEEIAEAMEALGLTYADLLDPANLKQLVGELSGEDELAALLTDAGLPNLLSELQEMGDELITGTGLTPEDIKGIEAELALGGEVDEEGAIRLTTEELPVYEPVDIITAEPLTVTDDTTETDADADAGVRMDADVAAAAADVSDEAVSVTADEIGIDELIDEAVRSEPVAPTDRTERPAEDEETQTETEPVRAETVPVKPETSYDETSDVYDTPEEGLTQLVRETGQTSADTSASGRDDSGAQEMLNRSRESRAGNIEASVNAAESTAAQTFTQTVVNSQGEQAIELVQSYTSVDTQQVISQIVTQARTTISETVTQMEMLLNPENLGRMILQVSQQEGAVTARLIAQSEGVKEALQMQLELLRESLNQAGVKVEAVEVSVGTHEFERALEEGMTDTHNESGDADRRTDETDRQEGRRDINLNDPDGLEGVMSEEEALVAGMMRDQGNTMNITA